MDKLDPFVVELVRTGLKGDVPATRRHTRRLLKHLRTARGMDDALCRSIAKELASEAMHEPITRSTHRVTPGADISDSSALVQYDEQPHGFLPTLSTVIRQKIDQLLAERANASTLQDAGIEATRTVLMVGPPGVGKTMTAHYVAAELGLPLVGIDLATAMSSFLGRTAQNLRNAIHEARSQACVLLLDEVDAIAKRRDDPADIGELKRVVNFLLLELDNWPASGLLIAATNHPELLDRAFWRRFDLVLDFELPDEEMRTDLLNGELARYSSSVDPSSLQAVAELSVGLSGADLVHLVQTAVRRAVISRSKLKDLDLISVTADVVVRRASADGQLRRSYCRVCHDKLGLSHRDIAHRLGVSHVTVGRLLRSSSAGRARAAGKARIL